MGWLMQEFVDFLGKHAPFDALSGVDLERIARRTETEYFAEGAVIPEPDRDQRVLRVIRKGAVDVVDGGRIVDELVAGDTFGHASSLSGLASSVSMIAAENTVCYRIPDPWLRLDHPVVTTGGREFAAGSVLEFLRPALECPAEARIQDAARLMSVEGLSYILVRSHDGLGIVTDSDCRAKVATGLVPLGAPVSTIATIPVMSVGEAASAGAVFLEMVQHGVHHMVVVAPDGAARGVVRVVDLSSSDIRDPLMVRSAVEGADGVDELARAVGLLGPTLLELHDAGTPPLRIGALRSAIIDAVLAKLVSFHPDFGMSAPYSASWMALGSRAAGTAATVGRRHRAGVESAIVRRFRGPGCPAGVGRAGDRRRRALRTPTLSRWRECQQPVVQPVT